MKYKFFYDTDYSVAGLPFEVECPSVNDALIELSSYFARCGLSADSVRSHYYVTNDDGRTFRRVLKPHFEAFIRFRIDALLSIRTC